MLLCFIFTAAKPGFNIFSRCQEKKTRNRKKKTREGAGLWLELGLGLRSGGNFFLGLFFTSYYNVSKNQKHSLGGIL